MIKAIPFNKKIQLSVVKILINWLNFWLNSFQKILFKKLKLTPKNILIYKIGDIGDTVCAIPSFIAIRKNYPQAKITLLTSPWRKESIGAKELLSGAWYLDNIIVYYVHEKKSIFQKSFIKNLRRGNYDLFIQIPDDSIPFKVLLKNIFLAKLIGSRAAFGFRLRSLFWIFRKTQIDFGFEKNEVETILDILENNGIRVDKVEFELPITKELEIKVKNFLGKDFTDKKKLIVALCPGGKREEKRWPLERFVTLAGYLENHYNAKIIIVGGPGDIDWANHIKEHLKKSTFLVSAGELNVLEHFVLFKYCDFLVTNDTGLMHIAAFQKKPIIALFSAHNILGKWFPYGPGHEIIYHRFLNCNYSSSQCLKKSMEAISINEVKAACDRLINRLLLVRKS